MSRRPGARRIGVGLTLALALTLAPSAGRSEEDAEPAAEAVDPIDPDALAIATRAGDFLREAKRFSFSAESGYETVQGDGSKIEFGSVRRYLVERPDRVRVETLPRAGGHSLTLFDGKRFVQVDLDEKAYARADLAQPRDIDFVIDLVRERLDTPLPLAELLRNDPRREIEGSLEAAEVVGIEQLRGVDCDHLALRNPDTDVQFWIARGPQPLVRRIVITYRNLEGQPSFWADLDDWSLAPEVDAARFHYDPPQDFQRVRFDVRPAPPPPMDEEDAP
jgi:hypothetical protein